MITLNNQTAIKRLNFSLPMLAAVMIFILLLLEPEAAITGVGSGLSLCAATIIPSLFPFFVASGLISAMGIPALIGRACAPLMSRLFAVSGSGAVAFVMGLSGGYPLGAATVADVFKDGAVSKKEAERLLAFCNNSGPAFIIGAAGVGIFGSSAAGLWLYGIHIVAAIISGMLFAGKRDIVPREALSADVKFVKLSRAFPGCVKNSVVSVLGICGFVVFFSALVSILDSMGIFMSLAGWISVKTGCGISSVRALLTGLLELGSGIGSMSNMPLTPHSMALASFILGWGGLSVHCQTFSVLDGTDLSVTRYVWGKLLHGLLSALLAFSFGAFICR